MPRKLKKDQFVKERQLIANHIKLLINFFSRTKSATDKVMDWKERQVLNNFIMTAGKLIAKLEKSEVIKIE
ncbi:MAG: hypothetical protein HeimC3_40980 [Candidatus Heimdallarchaeota archaeon LC_3]|nr:MAG: hypothetical protein HeimC3_40980 [Candidatus Heimdallarchaeota archaeon LC_3]